MSLERVVRPFQAGDVFTARSIIPGIPPDGIQLSTDEPLLVWGGPNPGKYTDVPSDLQLIGFKVDMTEDSSKRVTETVRVENPTDPEQYVVIDRIKQTTMVNSQTGQTMNLQFADWKNTGSNDAKVISIP